MKFSLEKICEKIGEKNNPLFTVIPVAICKGIFRPTFTMTDKKQDPETKKYAAVREGATELIAIPTYIGMSWLTSKLAPSFSPEGKSVKKIFESSKTTLGFFGVCAAALFVIPSLCNIAMPHILKRLGKKKDKEATTQQHFPNETLIMHRKLPQEIIDLQLYTSYPTNSTNRNGGMRI